MMELVPMVALEPVPMVTQVLARMAFRVPKEAEASLLLSPELTVLVIRHELVELPEVQVLDVLALAVMVELAPQAAQVAPTSVYQALFLADLHVNRSSGAQACSAGTGGSANGGSSGPSGAGGIGIGGTRGKCIWRSWRP